MARAKKSAILVKFAAYLLHSAGLFLAYIATAYIGLELNAVSGFASLVWAPSGISLAALLLFGYRLSPAILAGAFLINYWTAAPVESAFGISLGNTLEAVAGTALLRRFGFQNSLQRVGDVVRFLVLGSVLSPLISASIGVFSLYFGQVLSQSSLLNTWFTWWVGDMIGIMVVSPLILSWATRSSVLTLINKRVEALAWFTSVVVSGLLIFGRPNAFTPLTFFVFPPIVWGALRFNLAFNSFATFVLSLIALWGTLQGYGPFVGENLNSRLLFLQLFIGVMIVATMLLTAAVSESKAAEEEVKKLNRKLREKIKEVERLNKLMVGYIQQERSEKIKAKQKIDIEE